MSNPSSFENDNPSQRPFRDTQQVSARSNWLRAAVLGSNDGIVSIAGLVVGVAGVTDSKSIILTAGIAGIIAGAVSMAAGEYMSVSTQRDIEKEALKLDSHNLTSPWRAAIASMSAFLIGSIIPLVAVMLPLGNLTIPVTFFSVIVALVFTGLLSAKLGGTKKTRSVIRIVTGGAIAMIVTYGISSLFNISGL
ncbi:VIT1/CCC1 transporter family protein [Candidatus Saccharibacteria bacterium]|nr:VIT1/CCC1 transporter family protein [Candidatus Saccharibacteria bacterium]